MARVPAACRPLAERPDTLMRVPSWRGSSRAKVRARGAPASVASLRNALTVFTYF